MSRMNGGLTWQERGRGLPKDTEGRGLALTPDGKTFYVANARAVFMTTNQGKKWTRDLLQRRPGRDLDGRREGAVRSRVLELAAGPDLVYAGTFSYIELEGRD